MTSKSVDRNPNNVEQLYTCPTCGNAIAGNFCQTCGEKKLDRHDFSFKHVIEEAFEGFTHFDNKFFRTAYLLLFKPGQLSVDFFNGKKVPYMRPFQMFVICNILFFLLAGKVNFFAQPLSSFNDYDPYIQLGSKKIIDSIVKSEAQWQLLAVEFNERMASDSKAFLAIFIPVFALGSIGVNKNKRKFLAEHLVFSAHFFTFILIFYTFFLVLIAQPYAKLAGQGFNQTFDMVSSLFCVSIISIYYGLAAKKFYGANSLRVIAGSVSIAILFMLALVSYRMLLFYKIILNSQF